MVSAVIAWELMHPALTGAIIGVRNENEARENDGRSQLEPVTRRNERDSGRANTLGRIEGSRGLGMFYAQDL